MASYVHSIAEATARLISASEIAEKESRERGDAKYRSDPTWANGLISASHKVASGVGRLASFVEKAKDGDLQENDLIATAKHVAACVKHLQMASKTRQGLSDSTQFDIGDSSKDVARGTANTVKVRLNSGEEKSYGGLCVVHEVSDDLGRSCSRRHEAKGRSCHQEKQIRFHVWCCWYVHTYFFISFITSHAHLSSSLVTSLGLSLITYRWHPCQTRAAVHDPSP